MRYGESVNDSGGRRNEPDAGLCATCLHARRIESDRKSVFYLCQHALVDATFPKYPRLPVMRCAVHQPGSLPAPRER
jgi:hypothetical protein